MHINFVRVMPANTSHTLIRAGSLFCTATVIILCAKPWLHKERERNESFGPLPIVCKYSTLSRTPVLIWTDIKSTNVYAVALPMTTCRLLTFESSMCQERRRCRKLIPMADVYLCWGHLVLHVYFSQLGPPKQGLYRIYIYRERER